MTEKAIQKKNTGKIQDNQTFKNAIVSTIYTG